MNESLKDIIKITILLLIIIGGGSAIYSFKNNHSNIYFLPEVYNWLYPLPSSVFIFATLVFLILGFSLKKRLHSMALLSFSSIFGIILQLIFTGLYSYGESNNRFLLSLINFYGLVNAFIHDLFGMVPMLIILNGFITGIFLFLSNEVGKSIKYLISARTRKN